MSLCEFMLLLMTLTMLVITFVALNANDNLRETIAKMQATINVLSHRKR